MEVGPDERGKQIRLFIDELLVPFPASLYSETLRDAWYGLLPYYSHQGKSMIEDLSASCELDLRFSSPPFLCWSEGLARRIFGEPELHIRNLVF